MRTIPVLISLVALFAFQQALAAPQYDKIIVGSRACFVMYDMQRNEVVETYNPQRCDVRMAANSTFKIPLSLMGFDSKILKDENNPEWKFKKEYTAILDTHRLDQTPKTWMRNSTVWYSQLLTKKLGMKKFKTYVTKFNYGNQDVSGNPGKNDGLTNSWLSSSLKISANEQIEFLKKLLNKELPVSNYANEKTQDILYVEDLYVGWKLYGKSGSGSMFVVGEPEKKTKTGWFIGWVEKENQRYLFALNLEDTQEFEEYGGVRARKYAKEILNKLEVLKR